MRWNWALIAVFVGFLTVAAGGGEPAVPVVVDDSGGDGSSAACKVLSASGSEMRPLQDLCRFAMSYRRSLPNFVCSQQTIRKSGDTKHDDVISAIVTYEDGRERYSGIRINGEPTSQKISRLKGLTSWGEFGNLLVMLFDRPGTTEFQFVRQDVARGVPVNVFRFHVPREGNQIWTLRDGHGERLPEYRGELLLTRDTNRLMQIDIEALGLDESFGFESFRSTTEFDVVPISGTGEYLLPMRSSSKACLRAKSGKMPACKTNLLELNSCHKFGSESKVLNAMPLE